MLSTKSIRPANETDVEQVGGLLHGKEDAVWADSDYRGAQSRVHPAKIAEAQCILATGEQLKAHVQGNVVPRPAA